MFLINHDDCIHTRIDVGTQIIVGMGYLKDINNCRHLNKSRHETFFKVLRPKVLWFQQGNFGPTSINSWTLLNQSEREIFNHHCQFEVSCRIVIFLFCSDFILAFSSLNSNQNRKGCFLKFQAVKRQLPCSVFAEF